MAACYDSDYCNVAMPVRMKDIAKDLGVSIITVSKVLRDHPDISRETKERVWKRMRDLNYRPNLAARALVTGRSFSVGLIVPDLMHPFFAEVAKGLSSFLRDKGYGVLIASTEESPEREREQIEQMLARRVDALVIASAQSTLESFRAIEERKAPYVLIDRQFPDLAANFVGNANETAGLLATEHLIAGGCQRIAHIRGPEFSTAMGRLAGYKRALANHRLEAPAEYVVVEQTADESGEVSGYEAMKKLLAVSPRPDAVFCFNDQTAMGAMQAVLDEGLRIPDDVALIGCGNVRYAGFLRVPLSSVDQRSMEMGQSAGELALSLIGAKAPVQPRSVLLEPSVVARESTRPVLG